MIVKNEDQWIWYAIKSILPYVHKFLICDTGSQDKTLDIINTINSSKIDLITTPTLDASQLISIRQRQLSQTKTNWLWMIDGDEIYPQKTAKEILQSIKSTQKIEGIIVKRYDLLGDIYHYQPNETVGGYRLFGKTAHHSLRIVRTTIAGLNITGTYPNEAFVDQHNTPLVDHPSQNFYFTKNRYLHTTYLSRSSIGKNLTTTLHRQKYKVELGAKLDQRHLPQVLSLIHI